ncbi:MAG TPA: Ppx/GppA phosphatase family protein [Anaerolineales bacterium]|jgi:exopolyphosphatase/guanosine-5'-triphosphate,3'-diphosphate pyrophosphatase|nr:exopolyphosphatase [Anaerolineae bacterium]HRJ55277.1 Ppx/GppA phosphatase family protein [Anaerolineales bacterium]HRK90168.1 Ppx/GppA phosphatase family protein [Anaerolineales bacterium]
MQTIAAIDVGSNAMRLVVGRVNYDGTLETLENLRLPVRLGQDAFSLGQIGEETAQLATDAFVRFRKVADDYGVGTIRAVATSAMREARNGDLLSDRIARATGIEIETISGDEEARLIHLAVSHAVHLKDKHAMLIDIGGGSVEVTLSRGNNILSTESYNMGTVRLLQKLSGKPTKLPFIELVREYAEATKRRIKREIGDSRIDLCVGTGGNIEEMGILRKKLFKRESDKAITLEELEKLISALGRLTVEERMRKFKLKPDRADVILPASIVLKMIAQEARAKEVRIPNVGLKDGILLDLAQSLGKASRPSPREQVWTSAMRLGEKYQFDSEHGNLVARLAGTLFDQTQSLHDLDHEDKMLLEVAAFLHDIGHFINTVDHDKHAWYIMQANPLIGLTKAQNEIVANVMRYHRKAMPGVQDENFRALSSKDRLVVIKLSALLRLADAMDVSHKRRVKDVSMKQVRNRWLLKLEGEEGLSLETWALEKRRSLFQDVFGMKLEIEAQR